MLVLLGIFGAALLYGDGMITPAITVLGAVEGLKVATPFFERFVVPLAVADSRRGSSRSSATARTGWGRLFGPIMVAWFATLAILGIAWIARYPDVLAALESAARRPAFLIENRGHGFAVLGAVLLVVTGAEVLYADMGRFGARPIVTLVCAVFPALLLQYFGQGALLLHSPDTRGSLSSQLAPGWALLPLVGMATAAAIIASQALISGAFSLTRQAIQLGYRAAAGTSSTPRRGKWGQVYVPQVNWFLAICTILIVIGFGSSGALVASYGIAVTMTMIITVLLLDVIAV